MIAAPTSLLESQMPRAGTALRPAVNGHHHTGRESGAAPLRFFSRRDGLQPTELAFDEERDRQDMGRLVAGCDAALESLMQRHAKRLFSQLVRLLRHKDEAQESVQEAFVRVYRHRESFDLRGKFSTWLYAIAFNLARDRLRRRARQPKFFSLEALAGPQFDNLQETLLARERSPDLAMEDQEWSEALADAIASLPESLRLSLVLFAEEGKSQAEIAAEMHCTVKAVEMRLYHARKHLQSRLKKLQRK